MLFHGVLRWQASFSVHVLDALRGREVKVGRDGVEVRFGADPMVSRHASKTHADTDYLERGFKPNPYTAVFHHEERDAEPDVVVPIISCQACRVKPCSHNDFLPLVLVDVV